MWNKGAKIAKFQRLGVDRPRPIATQALKRKAKGNDILGSILSEFLPTTTAAMEAQIHPVRL